MAETRCLVPGPRCWCAGDRIEILPRRGLADGALDVGTVGQFQNLVDQQGFESGDLGDVIDFQYRFRAREAVCQDGAKQPACLFGLPF